MPVALPTVAMLGVVVAHVPLLGVQLSVVVVPAHTVPVPEMDPGTPFTVTTDVTAQPVDTV